LVAAHRCPRGGISQTISIIVLILLLSLSVVAFSLILRESSYVQGAQLTVAYQEVQRAKEDLRITIYPEYIWLGPPENRFVNTTKVRITSNWAGESVIDYIVAVKVGGDRIEGPIDIRVGAFETVEDLKPSNLHPELAKYDNDYNAFANEIDYILFHTKLGNVFKAFIGSSPAQKIIANVTSTTVTRTSLINLTKVKVLTATTTATKWLCANGWDFVGVWVKDVDERRQTKSLWIDVSKGVTYITIKANFPEHIYYWSKRDKVRTYGKCSTKFITYYSGRGTFLSAIKFREIGGCTTSCRGGWHTITKTIWNPRTMPPKCPEGMTFVGCTSHYYPGMPIAIQTTCYCTKVTCWWPAGCVWPAGGWKCWVKEEGRDYIVLGCSFKVPGKVYGKVVFEPYYKLTLCKKATKKVLGCKGKTTPGCPPPKCQEGATKCIGIDLYKCDCVYKWYEPAKRWCPFCDWVLVKENAPECGAQPEPCPPVTITATKTVTVTTTSTKFVGAVTTTTKTVTTTMTKWLCIAKTVHNQFSVCGPTTIKTVREGAEPILYCTEKIPFRPSMAPPTLQERNIALMSRDDGVGMMTCLLFVLGAVAYLPSGRRSRIWILILLAALLSYLTLSAAPYPVSAGCTPSTTTKTVTTTVTKTTTTTITTTGTVTTTTTSPVTKTLTTVTKEVIIYTKYSYKTCYYWTDVTHEGYCKCLVSGNRIVSYSDCDFEWVTRSGGPEYKGFAGTSVGTTTRVLGTCPA